ncbi:hypothetical protein BESB_040920 [Besnoitia besnoiti]|uniref:Uncharacterized protein n=1 Tax=Besnoitia besnoiti TaxID=94643 RepID=A0A2A9MKA2_BESBE|nr:hypothetical protein BESB_040920 [Besnoitia besnoiti]PFH37634.1 hypothetical protein BESB_040920 [Besnoitia besnoiti]
MPFQPRSPVRRAPCNEARDSIFSVSLKTARLSALSPLAVPSESPLTSSEAPSSPPSSAAFAASAALTPPKETPEAWRAAYSARSAARAHPEARAPAQAVGRSEHSSFAVSAAAAFWRSYVAASGIVFTGPAEAKARAGNRQEEKESQEIEAEEEADVEAEEEADVEAEEEADVEAEEADVEAEEAADVEAEEAADVEAEEEADVEAEEEADGVVKEAEEEDQANGEVREEEEEGSEGMRDDEEIDAGNVMKEEEQEETNDEVREEQEEAEADDLVEEGEEYEAGEENIDQMRGEEEEDANEVMNELEEEADGAAEKEEDEADEEDDEIDEAPEDEVDEEEGDEGVREEDDVVEEEEEEASDDEVQGEDWKAECSPEESQRDSGARATAGEAHHDEDASGASRTGALLGPLEGEAEESAEKEEAKGSSEAKEEDRGESSREFRCELPAEDASEHAWETAERRENEREGRHTQHAFRLEETGDDERARLAAASSADRWLAKGEYSACVLENSQRGETQEPAESQPPQAGDEVEEESRRRDECEASAVDFSELEQEERDRGKGAQVGGETPEAATAEASEGSLTELDTCSLTPSKTEAPHARLRPRNADCLHPCSASSLGSGESASSSAAAAAAAPSGVRHSGLLAERSASKRRPREVVMLSLPTRAPRLPLAASLSSSFARLPADARRHALAASLSASRPPHVPDDAASEPETSDAESEGESDGSRAPAAQMPALPSPLAALLLALKLAASPLLPRSVSGREEAQRKRPAPEETESPRKRHQASSPAAPAAAEAREGDETGGEEPGAACVSGEAQGGEKRGKKAVAAVRPRELFHPYLVVLLGCAAAKDVAATLHLLRAISLMETSRRSEEVHSGEAHKEGKEGQGSTETAPSTELGDLRLALNAAIVAVTLFSPRAHREASLCARGEKVEKNSEEDTRETREREEGAAECGAVVFEEFCLRPLLRLVRSPAELSRLLHVAAAALSGAPLPIASMPGGEGSGEHNDEKGAEKREEELQGLSHVLGQRFSFLHLSFFARGDSPDDDEASQKDAATPARSPETSPPDGAEYSSPFSAGHFSLVATSTPSKLLAPIPSLLASSRSTLGLCLLFAAVLYVHHRMRDPRRRTPNALLLSPPRASSASASQRGAFSICSCERRGAGSSAGGSSSAASLLSGLCLAPQQGSSLPAICEACLSPFFVFLVLAAENMRISQAENDQPRVLGGGGSSRRGRTCDARGYRGPVSRLGRRPQPLLRPRLWSPTSGVGSAVAADAGGDGSQEGSLSSGREARRAEGNEARGKNEKKSGVAQASAFAPRDVKRAFQFMLRLYDRDSERATK